MKDLKTISKLVKSILEEDEQARNSDNYLYYRVCSIVGSKNGVDIEKMSMPVFLLNMKDNNMPPFESVRRTRQKIQAAFPELAACEAVEEYRIENEEKFRAYAKAVKL